MNRIASDLDKVFRGGSALVGGHRQILHRLLKHFDGPVSVRLWDGELCYGDTHAPCTVVLCQPGILRELVAGRNLVQLAEHFLAGDIEVEGNAEQLFQLVDYLDGVSLSKRDNWLTLFNILRLPTTKSKRDTQQVAGIGQRRRNSRETIAHHYDLSNDFYRLWLDPEMVYSCAYFRDESQSLADAQRDKLDYLCRKLHLAPGQTLLDIGCGWGSLICWAARHYGVHARGITLSEQQYQYAIHKIGELGLQECVSVELRNYRDLPESGLYDRVVSVGMFEHIGVKNFPEYFSTVKRVLKPGGLFLNHGITSESGWKRTPMTEFMNRYIFPDGELARISDVVDAMEQVGFEILDVESLRRHYSLTLRRWISALETKSQHARELVGEQAYRLWRIYMAGSAYYFNEGSNNVYQILAGNIRQPLVTPLRRESLYEHKDD
jgi:cyclopropane-fatty-acyl-phospholipid synthase